MKRLFALLIGASLILGLCACNDKVTSGTNSDLPREKETVNVFMLNGPTGIGAVNLMKKSKEGTAADNYKFSVVSDPNEIVSKLSNGEADIAAIATNLASKVFNRTKGGITVLAVNTLGVLNVITNGNTVVSSMADLKGKTVYTTGKSANPEYVINYLLAKNGLDPKKDLTINFKAQGSELATVFATEPNAVVIAPQPFASSITSKYMTSQIALDLTDEWEKVSGESALMMGCVVVRDDYLKKNKQTVDRFLGEYESSVKQSSSNTEATAALCEEYGIVSDAAVAKIAIPHCNLCYVTGSEMKTKLSGYLSVLYAADKASVGTRLPSDSFYYSK